MITLKELQKLAASDGSIRMHHGSDFASVTDIYKNGLDSAAAKSSGGSGDFWASNDIAEADWFAQVNPANGQPARLDFDLPASVILQMVSANPPEAQIHPNDGIEFFATGFQTMNASMTNKQVMTLP